MSKVKTDAIETRAGGTSVLTIGTATQTIKLPGGTPGADKVLTSNATGEASWAAAAAGGITHASQWRMTADTSTGLDPIKLNWGAVNAATPWVAATATPDSNTALGAPMSVNTTTGRWTFPVTGYWYVEFVCVYDPDNYNNTGSGGYIRFSDDGTDDTTFNPVTIEGNGITYAYYNTHSYVSCILDITNTTDCLVSFSLEPVVTTDWRGHSTKNKTYVTFTRLGDT